MKTTFELPEDAHYYGRKDDQGIAHLLTRSMRGPQVVACGQFARLVYAEDGAVTTYATCLWCVANNWTRLW